MGLVIFASVMAGFWVIALILSGHDNGGFRIGAVLPAAVGITLLRMFPRETIDEPQDAVPPPLGASHPAPVDIVDR